MQWLIDFRPKARLFWGTVICGAFASSLVSTLATRVPDVIDVPTPVPEQRGWQGLNIPMLETAGPSPPVYVMNLEIDDPLALLVHDEVRILLLTSQGVRLRLTSASLAIGGTPCAYEAPRGAIVAGRMLPLIRGPGCSLLYVAPTGALKLTVRLPQRNRIGLWAIQPAASAGQPNAIKVVGVPGHSGPLPFVSARYVSRLPATATRRIDLLAYMWQAFPGPSWIWAAMGVVIALVATGIALLPWESYPASAPAWTFAARATLGTGALALALGICYAVLVPPFQAADESNHFLNYGEIANRPEIATHSREWAALTHFSRLRFRSDERFRPVHVNRPLKEPWGQEVTGDGPKRSSNVQLWRLFDRYFHGLKVERTLLGLRLFNALVFALAVAGGTAAAIWLTNIPYPQLMPFAFLFVPSLPFFATYVSNYATLASAYVLFAFGVAVLTVGSERKPWSGFLLGLGMSATIMVSRSATPMVLLFGALLVSRLLATSPPFQTWRQSMVSAALFWGSLGVGAAIPLRFAPAEYKSYLWAWIKPYLPAIEGAWEWAGTNAWTLAAALLLLGVTLELGISRGRLVVHNRMTPYIVNGTRTTALLAATMLAALMLSSVFITFPTLQPIIAGDRPGVAEYIGAVMLSMLGFFRLRHADHLLSSSFWTGFGWLDTIPPDWFVSSLAALTGIAVISLLLYARARNRAVDVVNLVSLSVGFLATLMVYAFITLRLATDLHGRYLLGLYLSMVTICWSLPAIVPAANSLLRFRVPVLVGLCLTVHAYSLSFILGRYF